ncbi:hypothetical protein BH11CYA1_BH11CYA1_30620 [soil metagenome]
MKPDVPREHSGPADNNAATRLSHEAFEGPGRGMNKGPNGQPHFAHPQMAEGVKPPMDRVMGATGIAGAAPAERVLTPRMPAAAAERPLATVKALEAPKPTTLNPVEPHTPIKPPEVIVPPVEPHPPVKPPEVVVPPKPPVKPPEVVVPPVEPHPPVKPPEVPVPPVKPPEVPVPPRVPPTEPHTPIPPPDRPPVIREAARYSPPAEPTRPARLPERTTPAERTVKETPAAAKTEKIITPGLPPVAKINEGEHKKIIPGVVRKPEAENHVHITKKIVEKHGNDKDKPHAVPKPKEHKPQVHVEAHPKAHVKPHDDKPKAVPVRPENKTHTTIVGEGKIKQLHKEIAPLAPVALVDIQPIAKVEVIPPVAPVEIAVEKLQAPAAEITTSPAQSTGSNVWGEATVSYSPGTKTTVGTATIGKFFDQQNYGYVQGTADLTHGKLGNVSAMYGHSILSPYDESGKVRRGNVNVEAGVVLNTGAALEGSKLPIFGGTAARVGVNGYYQLDKEGKTNLYGSADYASNPKQADAQVGISHKINDVTVTGGYQVSKVAGYETGKYATTSINMKLSENTDLYVGAAIATKSDRKDDKYYAGLRFKF